MAVIRADPTSRCRGDLMVKPDAATPGPVFFDPTGRRQRGLRAAAAMAVGAAAALAAAAGIGLTVPAHAPPTSVTAPRAAASADPARTASVSALASAAAKPAAAKPAAAKDSSHRSAGRRT